MSANPKGAPEDLDRTLAEHTERALGLEVLSTRGSEGILLLIEAPAHVASPTVVRRITASLETAAAELNPTGGLIAGVSSVYEPESFARAYREAREVVRCIDRFTHGTGNRVLAVDDLGPARLFLANGEVSAIRHFIDDMLGPLLDEDVGVDRTDSHTGRLVRAESRHAPHRHPSWCAREHGAPPVVASARPHRPERHR